MFYFENQIIFKADKN